VDDFLRAFNGYVPYVAVVILALIYRHQMTAFISAVAGRVQDGSSVKMGSFLELGEPVTSTADAERIAEAKGEQFRVFGDPDRFKLLFTAQGQHWKKSTKAMEVPGGCLVQVSTERQSAAGDWTAAEALQYVPGVALQAQPGDRGFALRASG
jgi:hypothetical protein